MVKIDRVISVYLSLTSKTMRLWTLTFVSCFYHGWVFNKFTPLKISIQMIFTELLLQRKLSFLRVDTQVILFGGLSGALPAIFSPFRQVWSLGFSWSSLRDFWSVFLFDFLKWSTTLTRFTEYRIYNYRRWWRTLRSENMQILDYFWQDHFKMAIFGRYLIGDDDVWKHFKHWLSSFNVLVKHWTYLAKDMLINSKTSYLFYELIAAFDKFQWMLRYLSSKLSSSR